MTIQHTISKKLYLAKITGLICWLAFSLTIFLPLEKEYFILSLLPFLGFGGVVIYIVFLIKCPECKASIGRESMSGVSLFKSEIKLKTCPHCGAHFDASSQ